jgi:K+-sensing histidine kinase KdpD
MVNRTLRLRLPLLIGLVAPVGVAAALIPLRDEVDATNIALVLVAVVVAVAAMGQRLAGAIAALSAFGSFDFFHTRPYYSLAINNRSDLETALLLLAVGLFVGDLAARSNRHRSNADRSVADIARIHAVAELVADDARPSDVVTAVGNELKDLLSLRSVGFRTDAAAGPRPRLEKDGEVTLGELRWGVDTMGLPGKEVDLEVQGRGRTLGRFVLVPTPGLPVSWDRRVVAVALADQVGSALVDRGAAV